MSDLTSSEISRETLEAYLKPVLERYDVKWRGHGVIYVDYEHYNIQTLHLILNDLSYDLGGVLSSDQLQISRAGVA